MKMHLKHILLAHHGEYEYGSPKIPQTSEAFLVHLIDLMDSKMGTMEQVKKTDSTTGHWSGFVKHLDRIVYKNDLPFYPEYLPDDQGDDGRERDSRRPGTEKQHHEAKPQVEPKTSLGKMLGNIKITE
jgi:3'-5' exoribonuclease